MDSFSLYDDLPLFSGDLLVGWNPLADELPSLVQDELQQDQQMYTTLSLGDLVKGTQIEVPIQGYQEEQNLLDSALVDTKVNLVDLLQQENPLQPPLSPQASELVTEIDQSDLRAEDLLHKVSEMLIVNLSSGSLISESSSNSQSTSLLDLSSFGNLSGESGVLGDDEVDSILSGNDLNVDEVDNLFSNSSANVFAADILSPVSHEDVDRILSSSPASPYDASISSPSSSIMYCSSASSPYSMDMSSSPYSMDISCDTESSVVDTSDTGTTISMRYLREELLKPTPALSIQEETQPKRLTSRQKSQRQRVKYEPYSPPPIEKYQRSSASNIKVESRPCDQRKQRKKQQNKDAALRYRQKKRDEKLGVRGECEELEDKNNGLKEKVDSMTREIQYLKDLLSEVYKAKAASK